MDIVETAPHNYSHAGRYEGVGAHLFAIACQVSLDAGCDGFVAFTSKSDLVEYYKEKLNAEVFRDRTFKKIRQSPYGGRSRRVQG